LGEISTGAGNDLERATDIVKAMAGIYGMSDIAGLMVLEKQRNTFLNGGTTKDYSDNMAEKLDEHIKSMLQERYVIVKERLEEYRECIERIVATLSEHETIDGEVLRGLIEAYEIEFNIPTKMKHRLALMAEESKASKEGDESK
jgi:cell division protease FtsH